jgi:hypothetical protein
VKVQATQQNESRELTFRFQPIVLRDKYNEWWSLTIRSEGDYWIVCVERFGDSYRDCAKGNDLAALIRYMIPCYIEYVGTIRRIEKTLNVKVCEKFLGGGGR